MSTPPIRHLVVFKDSGDAVPIYMGPFISLDDAESCKMELPKPLPGGSIKVREIYAHGTMARVKHVINTRRKQLATTQ